MILWGFRFYYSTNPILEGQVPSKEYSDVIRAVLVSPAYNEKQKLTENRGKLIDAVYKKSMAAAEANLNSNTNVC